MHNNPETQKKYRDVPEHKLKMKMYQKLYRQTHIEYFREYSKKREQQKRKSSSLFLKSDFV